jgi:cellulose synthase/poly-beta-1,6-N-acetylglucosamine synthase-like glycosyltransferase
MSLIKAVWIIIQFVIGYNLIMPFLVYILAAFRKKRITKYKSEGEADYAVIVTAYEQINLLPAVVNSILNLNYKNFLIYIVADKCDITNLHFDDPRVILLRPEKTLASNTRSHFYAIDRFKRKHERLTIIDSDNLVHPEYLNELNVFFDQSFNAVQGVRAAKNLDTEYACLDAARDIYYHYYDGKLLFEAGASATLAGSGMAFTTELYKDCLQQLEIEGAGFDKVLQYEIVKRKYRIAFAEKAIVYDEKTSRYPQLVAQRSRWIYTWFKYFGFGFKLISKGIAELNWNQFLFGLILLRPPLFIFLILSVLCFIIDIAIWPQATLVWSIGFLLFVLSFIIALTSSRPDKRIYYALINIPKFIWLQLVSLSRIKVANKLSVATQHYHKEKIN